MLALTRHSLTDAGFESDSSSRVVATRSEPGSNWRYSVRDESFKQGDPARAPLDSAGHPTVSCCALRRTPCATICSASPWVVSPSAWNHAGPLSCRPRIAVAETETATSHVPKRILAGCVWLFGSLDSECVGSSLGGRELNAADCHRGSSWKCTAGRNHRRRIENWGGFTYCGDGARSMGASNFRRRHPSYMTGLLRTHFLHARAS